MVNPIKDNEFLKKLDKEKNREIYARITLLTFDEQPIEYIEGKVTGGSINIDGTSALRRTCNLSMISANLNINIFLLGLERKFKLEIGMRNTIDSTYPDIIWFKQGIYVTTNVTTTRQVSNYSISIQGKDKMCLLNGDVSGSLPSSIDFGTIEEISDDGKMITYKDLEIKDIIYHAVETYGNEQPHNIIINDLEELSLQLLEYKGDSPMYIFRDSENNSFLNFTLNENQEVYLKNSSKGVKVGELGNYDTLLENLSDPIMVALKQGEEPKYTVVKAIYGYAVGYKETPLTYAGDLIANVGETIVSVLDKIKNMLGNYEYFYDLDGRFVFQKKKTYIDEPWSPLHSNGEETYYENNRLVSSIFYNFEDNELVTSFNNNPNLANIKNDYSIWGKREGVSGADIPIHLRFAIDMKPTYYKTYDEVYTFIASDNYKRDGNIIYCDWREIIYQMSLDYNKLRDIKEDFYFKIQDNNLDENGISLYPGGRTGYEQYYTDIQGFWRSLYAPEGFYQQVLLSEKTYKKNKYYIKVYEEATEVKRFPKYELVKNRKFDDSLIYYEIKENFNKEEIKNQGYLSTPFSSEITDHPNMLNFWIDFHEGNSDLSKYSVKAIGQRPKNVNDSNITSIYYRRVPDLIFYTGEIEDTKQSSAYTYVKSNTSLENCLAVSSQGKSAWNEMQVYLNDNTSAAETVSLTVLPIYYLEPNVRVAIKDDESKINGEYIISKITLPLTYNGTMNLNVTKVYNNIY